METQSLGELTRRKHVLEIPYCWSAPSPWHVTWPIYGLAAPIQYYLCATPPSGYDPYAFNARTSYLIT
jgi:hypothetical protein